MDTQSGPQTILKEMQSRFLNLKVSFKLKPSTYEVPQRFFDDIKKDYVIQTVTKKYEQFSLDENCPVCNEIKEFLKNSEVTNYRFLIPDHVYTREYRPDRINISINKEGIIDKISLG